MNDRPEFDGGFEPVDDYGVIPAGLFSDYSQEPFKTCLICEEWLKDGRPYVIQKAYRGTECIMEMAVCQVCYESMTKQYSEESQLHLLDVQKQSNSLLQRKLSYEHCMLCPMPKLEITNYSVATLCRDDVMLTPPDVLCQRCETRVQQSLSQRTRDMYDDFVGSHFPGLPAEMPMPI